MKRVIIFIHGMCINYKCWHFFKNYFEKNGHRCIALNLLYHENIQTSYQNLEGVSLLDYVDDLEKQIDNLCLLEPPIIIGHSMGGLLTQIIATRIKTKALVLLAPAPPRGIMLMPNSTLWTFKDVMLKWAFWKKPFIFPETAVNYGILNCVDEKQRKIFIKQMVYESGQAAFEIGMWPLDPAKASKVEFEKIRSKLLFISGIHDKIVPASVVYKNSQKYPHAEYIELPNGHMLQLENNHNEVAKFILEWLKK